MYKRAFFLYFIPQSDNKLNANSTQRRLSVFMLCGEDNYIFFMCIRP